MTRRCILIIFLGLIFIFAIPQNNSVYAISESEVEDELNNTIDDTLSDMDFDKLDNLVEELTDKNNLFGNMTFSEKVRALINGEYELDFSNIISLIMSLLFGNIKTFVPIVMSLVALGVLSVIVTSIKSKGDSGVNSTIKFACFAAAIIVISSVVYNVIDVTRGALSDMSGQINALMPPLMAMLVAVGSAVSVSIFSPVVAILTSGVANIFRYILLPLFLLSFIFTIIGNLSKNIKLNKFVDFISSTFKYILGFAFTIFSGVLLVQGIVANKYDNISFKATKFALKSYIPLIGGYLADGFDYVVMGSVLIKNAIGVGGLILLLSTILAPIITIIILRLALMLVASLLEPIGANDISNFASSCVKVLNYPIVLILGVAFMYILSIGLILCTGNIV